MGDIEELGDIVAEAFARPELAGHGAYLPLVGDFMSFNDIVETLNRQGHRLTFTQVPAEGFPEEFVQMFRYWEAHTYLGSDSHDRIALAAKVVGAPPTRFAAWTQETFPRARAPAKEHA